MIAVKNVLEYDFMLPIFLALQPLDDFCRVTHREIQRIMGRKVPSTDVWLMSSANRPLAPECLFTAPELARLPPDDLRTLTKRDPVQIRKYFSNPAFTWDEPPEHEPEKKETPSPTESVQKINIEISKKESPEKENVSTTSSHEKIRVEDEFIDPETGDMDMGSKRVSFALPDEEEGTEVVPAPDEEEEEEEVEEEEEIEPQEESSSKPKTKADEGKSDD